MAAYVVSHHAQEELIKYAAKIDASINNLKYVKSLKIVGKPFAVAGAFATGYQVAKDYQKGTVYTGSAKIAAFGVATAAAFIPVVGWGVAAGIGFADAIWGDKI